MSSAGTRERTTFVTLEVPGFTEPSKGKNSPQSKIVKLGEGKQLTVSESHLYNRKKGIYDGGGPFFTSRSTPFIKPGHVENASLADGSAFYSGPVLPSMPTTTTMNSVGYQHVGGSYGAKNEAQMTKDGATAVSLCSPTNPTSDLGTSMAESFREGIPSLPGIQSWEARTKVLKGLGSEYLNYQFGWAPLQKEVSSVVDTARHHREIMNNYHHNEGRNTHRAFSFPSSSESASLPDEFQYPLSVGPGSTDWVVGAYRPSSHVSLVRETHRWFEGCFTYAGPTSTDSWGRHIGFGSDADQLYGLALTPDVLWELVPWSWAVDWFSNAGEVINNVTNFGAAGLVMRYGYMMEESIERVSVEVDSALFHRYNTKTGKLETTMSTPCARGHETVTKRRGAANPFGFGVGWEGLSPTQLAITAALGITKLL
jgi:hypothetical protein